MTVLKKTDTNRAAAGGRRSVTPSCGRRRQAWISRGARRRAPRAYHGVYMTVSVTALFR